MGATVTRHQDMCGSVLLLPLPGTLKLAYACFCCGLQFCRIVVEELQLCIINTSVGAVYLFFWLWCAGAKWVSTIMAPHQYACMQRALRPCIASS
jgi:hypothetical protein